jgi:DNA polymerase III alpha subunit
MSLRLGLRIIRGLRREDAAAIERAREAGPFVSMDDFARRTGLGQAVIKRLAEADAFSSLGANRRQALWESLGQERNRVSQPLFDLLPLSLQHDALSLSHDAGAISGSRNAAKVNSQGRQPLENENIETEAPKGRQTLTNCHDNHQGLTPLAIDCRPFGSNRQQTHHAKEGEGRGVSLPPMPQYEEVVADYRAVGLSLKAHPISFYRQQLEQLKITPAQGLLELANGAKVTVAGLVLLRQRPSTAKGITFVTLEDETGTVNLVVHQQTWDRFYRIARRAPAWIAHGHLQTTGAMPSLAPTCSREAIDRDRERGHDSASREHATSVIHVVVSRLEALGDQLRKLDVKSRDFR